MKRTLLLLVLSACGTSGDKPKASTSASSSPAKGGCPEGAFADPEGAFCVAPPAAYAAGAPKPYHDISVVTEFVKGDRGAISNHGNVFSVLRMQSAERTVATETQWWVPKSPTIEVLGQGDLPGGKWVRYKDTKYNIIYGKAAVKGPKGVVVCEARDTDAKRPELHEVCKTLTAPAA